MTLSFETNAVPSPNASTAAQVLFGPNSVSITSPTFVVTTEPYYILAFNLVSGQSVRVEMLSGTHAANFRPLGKTITLNPAQTMLRIDWPGRYRLVFTGVSVTSIYVVGYAATTTTDTVYGVSANNGGASDFVSVVGETPIQVTGSGAVADPYEVSILNLNFLHGSINLGPNAGDDATGSFNTIIGLNAGDTSTINGSVVIGQDTGASAGGNNSVIIGINAGNTATGDDCVLIGDEAGTAVGGIGNIAIGPSSAANLVGSNNICIGSTTGTSVNGTSNVFIGENAGNTSTADNAICIGLAAGFGVTQDEVICIGKNAGNGMTGSGNIAIGRQAGLTVTGIDNICIGIQAGELLGNDKCIVIGNGAGVGATFPDNTIAIGAGAGSSATAGGIYVGTSAGDANAFADVIIIDEANSGLSATAANYCMLGSAAITHTVTAGSVIAAGAISASDSRLKRNTKALPDPTHLLNALRVISFNWDQAALDDAGLPYGRQDITRNHTGVIAQELEKILPDVIEHVTGSDGELYKFVHYDRLIPLLIAGFQTLDARLSALENAK